MLLIYHRIRPNIIALSKKYADSTGVRVILNRPFRLRGAGRNDLCAPLEAEFWTDGQAGSRHNLGCPDLGARGVGRLGCVCAKGALPCFILDRSRSPFAFPSLGILFVRYLRRNKPIQDTVGGVPVRWPPSSPTARAARVSDTEKATMSPPPARARHAAQQTPFGSSSHNPPLSFDLEAQPSSSESVVQASAATDEARRHAETGGQTRLEGGLPARHDRQEPVSGA